MITAEEAKLNSYLSIIGSDVMDDLSHHIRMRYECGHTDVVYDVDGLSDQVVDIIKRYLSIKGFTVGTAYGVESGIFISWG